MRSSRLVFFYQKEEMFPSKKELEDRTLDAHQVFVWVAMRLDHFWRPVYSYSWVEFGWLKWAFEKESTWETGHLGIHFLQCGLQGPHYLPGSFGGLPLDFVQFSLPFVPFSVVCKWLPLQPVSTLRLSWVLKASEKHPNSLFSVSFCYRVAPIDANYSLQMP